MNDNFLTGATSSTTVQSLGKITLRAPAVGAKTFFLPAGCNGNLTVLNLLSSMYVSLDQMYKNSLHRLLTFDICFSEQINHILSLSPTKSISCVTCFRQSCEQCHGSQCIPVLQYIQSVLLRLFHEMKKLTHRLFGAP